MPCVCPWSVEQLSYDGACTHPAYIEGFREGGAQGLAGQALIDHFITKKERDRKKHIEIYWRLKQTDFDRWQHQRRTYESRRDPEESRAKSRAVARRAKETRRFACDLCDKACRTSTALRAHYASQAHKDKEAGIVHPVKLIDTPPELRTCTVYEYFRFRRLQFRRARWISAAGIPPILQ
ncbi:hypothetical protein F503_06827 [Ophiostoma piceae UAMH 11346]|uniref:C2H2-type domain-containing protein n=1 Tax=Ophiostoma piceae (strain UAMH 11346) TaxID=1262450 RepID=S3CAU6_OPHP1|nr:hypothetical protein F503_06827 [Ophiostoma piceae UAMH 11346]